MTRTMISISPMDMAVSPVAVARPRPQDQLRVQYLVCSAIMGRWLAETTERARLNAMVQAELSCRLFLTRQRTTRFGLGNACWQSRIASGVQASISAWV